MFNMENGWPIHEWIITESNDWDKKRRKEAKNRVIKEHVQTNLLEEMKNET